MKHAYALAKSAEIAHFFSKKSSRAASDQSHRNPGWLAAYKAGRGAKKPARSIDMRIAMQEVLGPDEWLDKTDDPEFDEAVREAEAGPLLPW